MLREHCIPMQDKLTRSPRYAIPIRPRGIGLRLEVVFVRRLRTDIRGLRTQVRRRQTLVH